jgi:phage I-like protein
VVGGPGRGGQGGGLVQAGGARRRALGDERHLDAEGRAMLKAREYRYCSPAFDSDDDGTITELVNCAITNLPATKRMEPLMASRAGEPGIPPKEKTMKVLLSKLGLSENASEAEAIAKLEALQAFNGQVFALTGKTSIAESIGVLNAWRANEAEVVRLGKALADVEGQGR